MRALPQPDAARVETFYLPPGQVTAPAVPDEVHWTGGPSILPEAERAEALRRALLERLGHDNDAVRGTVDLGDRDSDEQG